MVRQPWLVFLAALFALIVILPAVLSGGQHRSPPTRPLARGLTLRVHLADRNEVREMPLEEYVAGVVAGEMPPSFHLDALKAQAVVARTYALRRMRAFGGQGCAAAPEADVCAGTQHQVYVDAAELRSRHGWLTATLHGRAAHRAARETAGLMITYEGEPIDAVYHSASAGSTEDAGEVWQRPLPYLVPVRSDDRTSPRYRETVEMSLAEFARRLGVPAIAAAASGRPAIQVLDLTAGGRVRRLRVGDAVLKGTEVRDRLGLRSAQFTIRSGGRGVVIETAGSGHGVGMSQYGANEMAQAGKTFREIIAHYYRGVRVVPIFTE